MVHIILHEFIGIRCFTKLDILAETHKAFFLNFFYANLVATCFLENENTLGLQIAKKYIL